MVLNWSQKFHLTLGPSLEICKSSGKKTVNPLLNISFRPCSIMTKTNYRNLSSRNLVLADISKACPDNNLTFFIDFKQNGSIIEICSMFTWTLLKMLLQAVINYIKQFSITKCKVFSITTLWVHGFKWFV